MKKRCIFAALFSGSSSVGRARPCQGRGREFESRLPLLKNQGCPGGGIGRHEGLKIPWLLQPCGFKSHPGYLFKADDRQVISRFYVDMKFESLVKSYKIYLQVELGMSQNTILGYVSDVSEFMKFVDENDSIQKITDINQQTILDYLCKLLDTNISKKSQARFISSMRSFYRFLMLDEAVKENPMDSVELPKLGKHLPNVLTVEEVEKILNSVDLSLPNGQRNRAILETLYSCGLRVSELINLRLSDIYFDEGFVRVFGKGSKERLVPIGAPAIKQIKYYLQYNRYRIKAKKEDEDIVFLNNRGAKLTREMVFIIVKEQTAIAGVNKKVSPHTFRHSFATHLIQNGADVRIVQEMLGHESIMTTEIYTHIDRNMLRNVIEKYHPFSRE